MLNRMFKIAAMFALLTASIAIASAKSYSFTLTGSSQAGSVELKPDVYTLKVEGSQIVLTNSARHQILVDAKIEAADQKYDQTAVFTSKVNGTDRLESVELGGTRSKVVFQ